MPQSLPFPDFHPEVNAISRSLYESGYFTDALRKASIRLEELCKQILFDLTGDELSGKPLMQKLFGYKNKPTRKYDSENKEDEDVDIIEDADCLFPFVNLSVKDNPAKQEGYCNLFSGFASTIRNTLAHSSDDLDDIEALYGLNIVSYLFYKLDRAKEMNSLEIVAAELQTIPEVMPHNPKFESVLIELLLSDTRIQDIPNQTQDQGLAKLTIRKISEEIFTEKIDVIGEQSYNYYFEQSEPIILLILQSLYGTA